MKLKVVLGIFFFFFAPLISPSLSPSLSPSFAQPSGMRPGPGMGMRAWRGEDQCWKASDLNLSSDQAKGLELIQQSYLRETQPLRAELFLKRLELRDFLTNPTTRIESIRSKYSEINELQSRLAEKVIEYLIKVRNLLTKEQLKNWCPELEIPLFRRMMQGPGSVGPMSPKRTPFQERLKED
jgi:hypothetical protein